MTRNYLHKKILIFGMGLTGISCLNFFLSKGIYPKIMDTDKRPKHIEKIIKFKNICYHTGSVNYSWILQSNLIIVSPGITPSHPALKFATKKNIEIIGDIELFVQETKVPIIAITGSNGKSSVTKIVKEIIQKAGFTTYIGGNIGIPALNIVNKFAHFFILELSSFQLERTFSLKAYIATILNITPDHLNRYSSDIKEYEKAKQKIYKNSKICIINVDNPVTINRQAQLTKCISFGVHSGDYHLSHTYTNTWLCYKSLKLINTKKLKLSGRHNYINMLSALAIVHELKISFKISVRILKNFLGLPHRCQKVYKNNNITWINDSKSTNIASTKSAIQSINTKGKIRLILGGDKKSSNLNLLKPILKNNAIVIYCYGKDKKELFNLYPHKSKIFETLQEVMQHISVQVQPGDVVLLSPACSSLDQFSGFEERGNTFVKLIQELIH
ncbi:UDP-N-acetylmuramoylalanine-D-glutamate ligase [Buchnera aphidicola str. Bp (Baizongia pistaciae)]|uniref:UDP-N-acetylmuramoylalanine--D-glutamate ligase n=1 Tax=Buchnera aphidicola subsp. Baizongia pistaciae (strain Bp) TaxID=224915 RepID=MURD_BUCBP|nr:UDP-N-acetylmuramoyl-L-alanine--D-glutamate ligase [Buchnera aphidicola]Q89AQ2.1 RecName: Full=UDP-N-acetylmuramoylalanine--D-glutamate ligase; AltName: Full=D-glutamic acid-adding enzyme; AltName: Full=UDP-N-acetylmuramoyl-L-alanyl-D-glutamate synthetase [Buchnera aphidicola str. Bp (Baizongia pistaciae)]AAO26932.1 UDP-N-acetylmuramoylalanine-D-glutamate ligase [Buchnera aphidicola str. Bp (Baizongia pistaciae)]